MKKLIIGLTVGMLLGSSTVALAATNTVQATLQKFRIVIDGTPRTGTSTQLLYKGTTYVPIRDTAGLFDYSVNFDNNSKSISFNSNNSYSDGWVTLNDFQIANSDLNVHLNGEDTYEVTNGKSVQLIKINTSTLEDGENSTIYDVNSKKIKIKKVLGAIYLNKQDLKDAGYRAK